MLLHSGKKNKNIPLMVYLEVFDVKVGTQSTLPAEFSKEENKVIGKVLSKSSLTEFSKEENKIIGRILKN